MLKTIFTIQEIESILAIAAGERLQITGKHLTQYRWVIIDGTINSVELKVEEKESL